MSKELDSGNVINDIARLDLLRKIRADLKTREIYLIDKASGTASKLHDTYTNSSRHSSDRIGNYIDDLAAVQEEIRELDLEMERRELRVLEAIAGLPNDEGNVIFFRYIKRMSWKRVASSMNYSIKHCQRLRRKAIDLLKEDR